MKPLGASLLLLAALTHAQTYEIRGTVTELGVGGIAGMEIKAQDFGAASRVRTTALTDSRGAFRIRLNRPGSYWVQPTFGEPYFSLAVDGIGFARLDDATPQVEIHFSLGRKGQITGQVLDEETRQPVPDYPLYLYTHGPNGIGTSNFGEAVTSGVGRFTLTGVRPADYVIGTRPPMRSRYGNSAAPIHDRDIVDQGYAESYWPGGVSNPMEASRIRLASGGIVDVGNILLRKVPFYRIRLSIPSGECPDGESVRLLVLQAGEFDPLRPPSMFTCGREGLLRDFEPGSYTLYAVSHWQTEADGFENAAWAIAPVTVDDKNEDVTLVMQRGVVLEGRKTTVEGVHPEEVRPTIWSRPVDLIPGTLLPMEQFVDWTSDTTFRMVVHPSPQELRFTAPRGLPSAYAKEIRYNGSPVRDEVIPVSAGTGSHTLEIVFDDKFSSLTVTVSDGTKPVAAFVALVKSSIDLASSEGGLSGTTETARPFRIARLPPGDYRIFAIPVAQVARLRAPGVRQRLAAAAERITIAPGASQTVTLRLTDISR